MAKRINDIEKYLKGELTPAEMHALEKQALNDPFLAEALEGGSQLNATDFSNDVAELNAKIVKRKTFIPAWPLRIAAGFLLITVAAIIIWSVLDQEPEQQLALEENTVKEIPETVQSKPSIPAPQKENQQPSTELREQVAQTPENPPKERSKKSASNTVVEKEKTESARSADNRVKSLSREKRLDQKNEVAKIDPTKKDELRSPSANEIKIAEGYIASIDARPTIITGWVMSAEDGTPLSDVDVAVKGTSVKTKTDAKGRYAITANTPNKTLVYSSEGLESTEVKIDGIDSTYLPVKLEITDEAQKEAAVQPSDLNFDFIPTKVFTIPAHPESGNREFKQYLEDNHKYPQEAKAAKIEGTVVIEFKVDATGALSEFKIVRGIGKGCDEELIRLILQGTKWIPTTKDGVSVSDKARVRFKFELED